MNATTASRTLAKKFNPPAAPSIRRVGLRTWEVESRTRKGLFHRIDWTLDGELLCNCEAGSFKQAECWAVQQVRKEVMTATETRDVVPVQLNPRTALLPSERDMKLIDRAAAMVFAGAVALPKELNTPEKVGAVMLYGLELGLAPMSALRHLYIVNGKVQPSTEVMAGLLLSRHPSVRLKVDELNDQRCVMRLIWPERDVNDTYIVTWEDIKRAKLDGGEVAQKYPQDRLRYHATKRLLRIYAPDVINGLDAGAPLIDPAAATDADDQIDDAELWNPGEVIDAESKVVDADGVVESVPTASDEQVATIKEWAEAIVDRHGQPKLVELCKWAAEQFPYAVDGSSFKASKLTQENASSYIAAAKAMAETGSLPVQGSPFL